MSDFDRSIDGDGKTVADILEKKKYSIDYYQREYKWESKQLKELVADLTTKFIELHEPDHARKDVAKYARLLPRLDHHFAEGEPAVHRRWPAAAYQPDPAPHLPPTDYNVVARTRSTSIS